MPDLRALEDIRPIGGGRTSVPAPTGEGNLLNSRLLQRKLDFALVNPITGGNDAISLATAKLVIKGDKYIGVQQDTFSIVTYNIDSYILATWIDQGYTSVVISVDSAPVFVGVITNVTTGAPDIVNREIVITCLSRTTVFLTNLVEPFTLPSSMNVFNILKTMMGDGVEIPEHLQDVFLDSDLNVEGDYRNDLDAIIQAVNTKVDTNDWIEIHYDHERVELLSGRKTLTHAYVIDADSGLIAIPKLSESGLSFPHIYRKELTPGVAIHIDNSIISTLGVNSAFLFTMDPNQTYMITHVRYNFQNYDGATLTCEIECYPYSKFYNWSIK